MGLITKQYKRGFTRIKPQYYMIDHAADLAAYRIIPHEQEITAEKFEEMVRSKYQPDQEAIVLQILDFAKTTNGQFVYSNTITLKHVSVRPK